MHTVRLIVLMAKIQKILVNLLKKAISYTFLDFLMAVLIENRNFAFANCNINH